MGEPDHAMPFLKQKRRRLPASRREQIRRRGQAASRLRALLPHNAGKEECAGSQEFKTDVAALRC
jgi:hypothetical protein